MKKTEDIVMHPLWIGPVMLIFVAVLIQTLHTLTHWHMQIAADDTETQFSGKVGASVGISEDLAVYAELSGISAEDATGDDIVNFGGKLGAKFVF